MHSAGSAMAVAVVVVAGVEAGAEAEVVAASAVRGSAVEIKTVRCP